MTLSLDRQAFLDILTEGKGNLGGVMQPPPEGVWGMPREVLYTLPGYAPDLNPDEGVWDQLKYIELRNVACHNQDELRQELRRRLGRLLLAVIW